MLRRFLAILFFLLIVVSLLQCGRRGGTLTGGPKDEDPPVLEKSEPENLTTNFKADKIRLYFDEYIKLKDVQDQLIVSPPLKYQPELTPQGGAQKYIEIKIKDTLLPKTTYTINFGQSVQDNNEGNPSSFLTYVFSTGAYIDSLEVQGVIKDAFKQKADEFISVMLYEIDSAYTDSTLFKKPPNYITNTLDSTVIFSLKNIKKGQYAIFALKDEAKNNIFDQNADKIGFLRDTITLPSDSIQLPVLTLFKEIPNYSASVPRFVARNKIIFGYYGDENETIEITPLTTIPDTVKTRILKERDKDSINFWFTPNEMDSIVFTVTNEAKKVIDTFTVKRRKVGIDSLKIVPNQSGSLDFNKSFYLEANTPLTQIDTSKMKMLVKDSIPFDFDVSFDTITNKISFSFPLDADENYTLDLLPGAITDFFGQTNDTTNYRLNTRSFADYSNLTVNLTGAISYPLIVQLADEKGETQIEFSVRDQIPIELKNINPASYRLRVIFDTNKNGKWDTGSYLRNIQPERVSYFPKLIELRPNWEENITFTLQE
jgi:uncharacterized protein (DUF2141 family)